MGLLPADLTQRIEEAVRTFRQVDRARGELTAQAALAIELAAQCTARPEALEELVEATDYEFDEWALNLPMDLAREGMAEEALRVADAWAEADERYAQDYACDAARILAVARRAEQARERIFQNLSRFGDIPYTWMASGEALAELGDVEGAAEAYDRAVEVAEDDDDQTAVSDAYEHLDLFLQDHPEATSRARRSGTTIRLSEIPGGQSVAQLTTKVSVGRDKVARNARCPCGSGRKYKRCCGSPR